MDSAPSIDLPAPSPSSDAASSWPRRAISAIASALDWLFGLLSLVLGLAIFSIIPLLNFLSLGYLLHASGQVAATGKLRAGFVGIRKASVLGSFFLGAFLVFLPVRIVSGLWKDAELIAAGSPRARAWHAALIILAILAVLQVIWASLRGGRLRHFLWPAPLGFVRWLRASDKFETIRNAVADYVASLRLPYYFWLGARGFFGAFLWLVLPVAVLMTASSLPPARGGAILSLVGGLALMVVVLYLPFLQTHFAMTNQFRNMFALRRVRAMFQRAPVAFLVALSATLLLALPLYLLKIELPPREIAWLPSLLFVVFIFPARLLTGWAVGRSYCRVAPRHFIFRWLGRFGVLPIAFAYVFILYLTQYLSWNGALSFLEQHAFMVPAPLLSL